MIIIVAILIFLTKNNQFINNSLSNQNTTNNSLVLSNNSSFKSCKTGETWACKAITRGEKSDEELPVVCGCIPDECPPGNKYLIISDTVEIWPDNSKKGRFECSNISIQ